MVRKVKAHKAGFVTSDANIRPDQTLGELLELKKRTGHSTTAVTEDGTPDGKIARSGDQQRLSYQPYVS